MFAGDLDYEADRELAEWTGGPYFSSRASIPMDYGRVGGECSVVSESVPSSVADMFQLNIRGVEAIIRAYILDVRVGAPESIPVSK